MIARAGQEVVVEDVPTIGDRQQPGHRIALPDRAEPTSAWAAARGEHVTRLDIAARYETLAAITVGHAADLDRRNVLPFLGEVFSHWLVVGERDGDVDLVRFGEPVRRAEIGERVVWCRLG